MYDIQTRDRRPVGIGSSATCLLPLSQTAEQRDGGAKANMSSRYNTAEADIGYVHPCIRRGTGLRCAVTTDEPQRALPLESTWFGRYHSCVKRGQSSVQTAPLSRRAYPRRLKRKLSINPRPAGPLDFPPPAGGGGGRLNAPPMISAPGRRREKRKAAFESSRKII